MVLGLYSSTMYPVCSFQLPPKHSFILHFQQCGQLFDNIAVLLSGLSGLDIIDAGMHLAQSGRALPMSSISANITLQHVIKP